MTLATVPIVIFIDAADGTTAALTRSLRVKARLIFDPDDYDVPAMLEAESGVVREPGADCILAMMSQDGFRALRHRIQSDPESYGLPAPPDPDEATAHAMKGRDVQQMIGGVKP